MEELKKIDILGSSNDRLIAGWASVEVVDRQGQIVPIDELNKALLRYSIRGAPLNYGHKNHQVGRVINWYIMKHPKTGKWGVYIIGYIFSGEKIYDVVWEAIKDGTLTGFSIAGIANRKEYDIVDGRSVEVLRDITITEISVVEKPANPEALIEEINKFAKSGDDSVIRIMGASFTKGIIDDAVNVAKENGVNEEIVADIVEEALRKFICGIAKQYDSKVMAVFDNEKDAFAYAIEKGGFVIPSYDGKFLVVRDKAHFDVKEDEKMYIEELDMGVEKVKVDVDMKDEEFEKSEGPVTVSSEGMMNPTYGSKWLKNKDEKSNVIGEVIMNLIRIKKEFKDNESVYYLIDDMIFKLHDLVGGDEMVKSIESDDDLRRILVGLLDEAKKLRGFVYKHTESLAYKGMADDIVKTFEHLIEELDSGQIEVAKGELTKDELLRILRGILDEAKKIAGFIRDHTESGAYRGMAEDVVNGLRALIGDVERSIIQVRKDSGVADDDMKIKEEAEKLKTKIEEINEVFSKQDEGRNRMMMMYGSIMQSIVDELEAIIFYADVAAMFDMFGYDEIAANVRSVISEELEHVREFTAMLEKLAIGDKPIKEIETNEEVAVPTPDQGIVEVSKKERGEHKKCMERYYNFEEGHFKGREGTGERFDNCVKAQMHCNGKSREEAEKICGMIARRKGYAGGKKVKKGKIDEIKARLEEVRKAAKKNCRKRYYDEDRGHFREMTCPDDPNEKSRFCGCVRYQMNCNGKSLEEAKEICGYIRFHVKKSVETELNMLLAKLRVAKARKTGHRKGKTEAQRRRERKQQGPGRPKDPCRQRFVDKNGFYRKMTDPKNPSKPASEFWGCVRYAMECKKMSYEEAKSWCGKAKYDAVEGGGEA